MDYIAVYFSQWHLKSGSKYSQRFSAWLAESTVFIFPVPTIYAYICYTYQILILLELLSLIMATDQKYNINV